MRGKILYINKESLLAILDGRVIMEKFPEGTRLDNISLDIERNGFALCLINNRWEDIQPGLMLPAYCPQMTEAPKKTDGLKKGFMDAVDTVATLLTKGEVPVSADNEPVVLENGKDVTDQIKPLLKCAYCNATNQLESIRISHFRCEKCERVNKWLPELGQVIKSEGQ